LRVRSNRTRRCSIHLKKLRLFSLSAADLACSALPPGAPRGRWAEVAQTDMAALRLLNDFNALLSRTGWSVESASAESLVDAVRSLSRPALRAGLRGQDARSAVAAARRARRRHPRRRARGSAAARQRRMRVHFRRLNARSRIADCSFLSFNKAVHENSSDAHAALAAAVGATTSECARRVHRRVSC